MEQKMRKLFLYGRSEAGKTTLIQALKGEELHYSKTQYINTWDVIIDTPGEYSESGKIGDKALSTFSYECDLLGLVMGADEPFCVLEPGQPTAINRPLIGIITKVDEERANVPMVRQWMDNAGCERVFEVDSVTGKGIQELRDYLCLPIAPTMSLQEAIYRQQNGIPEWEW